ncbi:DUF4190 domain-containing protein [Aeromicrobium sp. Leaf350]|uniref:DUF4190 domain-containing protein n=1 Tax=Aeromicrobium sp. Leaf350 TaxID=2876565 RepID=UPI001E3D7732|nr:DUF4190 domain-containing protein [Aeromicrobium sp. Leaf350]
MSTSDPNSNAGLPSYGSTPPPTGGYPPQAPGGYGMPAQNNSKAVVALVLGILAFVCCGPFTGIPAFIVGRKAKREIEQSQGTQSGAGLATAGWILGLVSSILFVLGAILWGILLATGSAEFTFETY